MSISSEIERIRSNIQSALGIVSDAGIEVASEATSDDLPAAVSALANQKQNVLTGTAGQYVGFDADGNAIAQSLDTGLGTAGAAPDSEAVGNYVFGGTMLATSKGVLKWDGVVGDREEVIIDDDGAGNVFSFVHISDEIPVTQSTYVYCGATMPKDTSKTDSPYTTMAECMPLTLYEDGLFEAGELMFCVPNDNYQMEEVLFPKAGIYFFLHETPINKFYISAFKLPDYDFVEDQHYEKVSSGIAYGDTITWDGNVDGRVSALVTDGSMSVTLVKMCDAVIPESSVEGITGCSGSVELNGEIFDVTGIAAMSTETDGIIALVGSTIGNASLAVAYLCYGYNVYLDGITFPEPGIYFCDISMPSDADEMKQRSVSLTVPGYDFGTYTSEEIIKTKHLPEPLRFGEYGTDTLTFTEDLEGKYYFDPDGSGAMYFVQVSDATPTLADLQRGGMHSGDGWCYTFSADTVQAAPDSEDVLMAAAYNDDKTGVSQIFVLLKDNVTMDTVTFAKKGIYVGMVAGYMDGKQEYITINGYDGFTKVVPVETKYMPEHLQFGDVATGDTLTWDGNANGLVSVSLAEGIDLVKVSDFAPSYSECVSAFNGAGINAFACINNTTSEMEIASDSITQLSDGVTVVTEAIFFVQESGVGVMIDTLTFPEAGTYLACVLQEDGSSMYVSSVTVSGYTGFTSIKRIDPKYVPSELPSPTTAHAGMHLAVGDDGKWTLVEASESSGSDTGSSDDTGGGSDTSTPITWTALTPINGTTPGEYGGGELRCAAIGNRRIIKGSVNVKPSSSTLVIAQLPSGYTPTTGVFAMTACNGSRVARILVAGENNTENAGKLCLSWVRSLSDGSAYTSDTIWVQCSIEYWVEDTQTAALVDSNGAVLLDSSEATLATTSGNTYTLTHTGAEVDAGITQANELYGKYTAGELSAAGLKSEIVMLSDVTLTKGAQLENQIITFPTQYCNADNYLCKFLVSSWPKETWTDAFVFNVHSDCTVEIGNPGTLFAYNQFGLATMATQRYDLIAQFLYYDK